ncbi:MAG: tRNA (adenosine(37)-N6)-threonylcarbamoyltransferase complex dimerization subunit type 1 TsaB [Candidatus Acidiferrales bacterium]
MLLLAVDTANQAGSLAVLKDGRLLGVISTASDEAYSSRLFRQLDFLLRELQIKTRDFDVFAVAAGPGSFTGLRVGLAAVKAWAEVFSKSIVAVSGLEAVAAQAQLASRRGLIAPVLDACRGQIYAALYRFNDSRLVTEDPEQVCTAQEFLARLASRTGNEQIHFIASCPAVLQPALDNWTATPAVISRAVEPASSVLAPIIGQLAFDRAARGEFIDSLRLDANYVRRSDAELLWKAP